jgi:hypoxanthine phosphoribosyltransferase
MPRTPERTPITGRLGRTLITRDEVAARVAELGQTIGRDYAGRSPLLVGVLKGAVVFTADLARAIPLRTGFDFMGVSSYGSRAQTSGVVRLTSDLSVSIEGRDVIIVEDIIDTGRTIHYLRRNLATRHPKSLALCVLLDKVARREVEVPVDYVGFVIPNDFVVGYGLDHDGLYRNLPDISVLERTSDAMAAGEAR